ncbi:hypothetical protein [Amphritea pacifica]|uniref:O-antigen ligase domain-containing protein n=1 Tax=Amphritea pacifica TaxID=2811233 RepID=A0ABS2W7U1_9GAMM|nr:hypothetical protein [Amphritea pacifica]MBN0987764.1 hypothetical protein [Amphritea pacifica]
MLLINTDVKAKSSRDIVFCYLVLLFLVVALLYILDPSDTSWGAEDVAFLKYFPVIIAALALSLVFFSNHSFTFEWPSLFNLIFFFAVVGGGVYTVLDGYSLKESFLGRGASIIAFFLGGRVLFHDFERFFIKFSYLVVLVGFLCGIGVAFWAGGFHFIDRPHIYHEEVFIFYAAFIASNYIFGKVSGFLFFLFFTICSILTFKNTGFLIALMIVVHFLYFFYRSYTGVYVSIFKRFFLFFVLVSFLLVVYWFFLNFSNLLPSGSPEVRLKTYEARLDMFFDYLWFGQFFYGSPLVELSTRFGSIEIPSHSDILDVLAFGGVIGFYFFIMPLLIFFLRFFSFDFNSEKNVVNLIVDLSASVVGSIFVIMLVNPVLNQPKISVIFWFCLGVGLAYTRKNIRNNF